MADEIVLVLGTSAGGTGRHVASLAAGLSRRGVRVTVCGPRSTEQHFEFAATGAEFVAAEIAAGVRPYADARAAYALRQVVPRACLVHAHGLRAALVAGLVTPRSTPYVVTWHNAVLAHGLLARGYVGLERVVARRADVTLCVSPDLVARVRALGGRDVRLAPVAAPSLPAPRRAAAEIRSELGSGDRPIVLSIGRLHPQKGYHALVKAAAMLTDHPAHPLFVIAGDGPGRAEIEGEIARAQAPVRLLGWRDDVADLLAAAAVVVAPSVWEGSPLAVQEAVRAGRPVIATDVGGVASLVGDGAHLVRPDDPAALSSAIAKVVDDRAYAVALAARATQAAARLPSEEAVLGRVSAVYAELLGHPL
jgi:glycosyltransferase involved in cell wall biosynthesis